MDASAIDTVTVVPRDARALTPGARSVFFAFGLVAGRTLLVQEVKRIPVDADKDVASVRSILAAADSAIADSTIVAGGRAADAVVLVQVDSIAPLYLPDSLAGLVSEHAPNWELAVGHVQAALRPRDSALVDRPIATIFAEGQVSFTEDAPQLHVGEARILWLRRTSRLPASLRPGIDTTGRYYVIEADNARPAGDASRVARLLGTKYTPPVSDSRPLVASDPKTHTDSRSMPGERETPPRVGCTLPKPMDCKVTRPTHVKHPPVKKHAPVKKYPPEKRP
jgi:hypothetical protein